MGQTCGGAGGSSIQNILKYIGWAEVHISRCNDDDDMQHDDEPEYNHERQLLCLVAELPLSHHRAGPAAQERQNVQSSLPYSTPAIDGSLLVHPVGYKTNSAHHDDDA